MATYEIHIFRIPLVQGRRPIVEAVFDTQSAAALWLAKEYGCDKANEDGTYNLGPVFPGNSLNEPNMAGCFSAYAKIVKRGA